MDKYLQAGGCHAGCHAHGILLCNACVKGLVRESLLQLSGIDAAHQVTVNMYHAAVLLHQLQHCGYIAVTVCTAVLLMLANQCIAHDSFPPYFPRISASAASAAAMASSHCSWVGCEECAPDGSAKVAPLPFLVFRIRAIGLFLVL